jgi:manganese/zinc/iron transport system substrate-binding protein
MIQFYAAATKKRLAGCVLSLLKRGATAASIALLLVYRNTHAAPTFTVVTTTGIIADSTRAIAGDTALVEPLMGAGVDPHLYKASPGDLRKLSNASLILYNGLHLEGKMADVLEKLGARKPVIAITKRLPRERLRSTDPNSEMSDPHIWFDVALWIEATKTIRDALMQHNPQAASIYSQRFDALSSKLQELHEWCRKEIADIPQSRRTMITAHDAFGYFGRAYGIEVLGIQGVSTDSEASLREINNLVQLLVERKIPAVFVESTVSPKAVEALIEGAASRGHRVAIGGELLSDALGKQGTPQGTYEGMVKHNVTTIKNALSLNEQRGPEHHP